jgi:hypothetical protein
MMEQPKGSFEKCRQYIELHSKNSSKPNVKYNPGPCITISRAPGSCAELLNEYIISFFNKNKKPDQGEWAAFDKNLINKVIEDHNLPEKVSEYMKEDKYSNITSVVQEMLGLHPPRWTLIQKTTETVLQLARMGNVIIVGRAGNLITSKLQNAFHVRLVAPLEDRIDNCIKIYQLTREESIEFIKKEDAARKNYVYANFNQNIEDPLLYNITINTHLLSYSDIAHIIGEAVLKIIK